MRIPLFTPPNLPSKPDDYADYFTKHGTALSKWGDDLQITLGKMSAFAEQIAPWRNRILNGGFTVNQGGYTSGTALAAGAYGHDGWKAGASGCTYTFTQLNGSTEITITAGSLIQVVEDKMVEGGPYILTWEGTAQGRVGVDSATPSGSYDTRFVRFSNTAGTTASVEFNTGTLKNVNMQPGRVASAYAARSYQQELALAQRYYRRINASVSTSAYFAAGAVLSATSAIFGGSAATQGMRALPTVGYGAVGDIFVFQSGGNTAITSITVQNPADYPVISIGTTGLTANAAALLLVGAGTNKYIEFSARL